VTLPGIELIHTAVQLGDKSIEADLVFGEKLLAQRLRDLSDSCYDVYQGLPENWKTTPVRSMNIPAAESLAA
jgi:hypothetical protein